MSATSPGGTSIHAQDQAKALWVAPVYLAGEEHDGGTRVVLPLLLDRSWTVASIRDDNVIVDSPCRRVRIGYMPTMPGYEARWVINASVDPLEPRHWQAAFDHGTPGEIVAAFTETVARDLESGNDRSLISDRNPDTALAVLRTAAWSQSRDPHGTGTELVPEELRYHDQLFTSPDGMASVRRRVRRPGPGPRRSRRAPKCGSSLLGFPVLPGAARSPRPPRPTWSRLSPGLSPRPWRCTATRRSWCRCCARTWWSAPTPPPRHRFAREWPRQPDVALP